MICAKPITSYCVDTRPSTAVFNTACTSPSIPTALPTIHARERETGKCDTPEARVLHRQVFQVFIGSSGSGCGLLQCRRQASACVLLDTLWYSIHLSTARMRYPSSVPFWTPLWIIRVVTDYIDLETYKCPNTLPTVNSCASIGVQELLPSLNSFGSHSWCIGPGTSDIPCSCYIAICRIPSAQSALMHAELDILYTNTLFHHIRRRVGADCSRSEQNHNIVTKNTFQSPANPSCPGYWSS